MPALGLDFIQLVPLGQVFLGVSATVVVRSIDLKLLPGPLVLVREVEAVHPAQDVAHGALRLRRGPAPRLAPPARQRGRRQAPPVVGRQRAPCGAAPLVAAVGVVHVVVVALVARLLGPEDVPLQPQVVLLAFEPMLLVSNDGTGTTNADPGDGLCRRESVVLHDVAGNEGPRAAQPCLAVNGQGPRGVLADLDELPHDGVAGRRPVHEEQVPVVEALLGKAPGVVDLLVQPHHRAHVVLAEVREVRLRGVERVAVLNFALGVRPAEGDELVWHNPVEVAVLNPLVVLVLLQVKVFKVQEFVADGLLHSTQTIKEGEVVCARTKGGIPEWDVGSIGPIHQWLVGFLRRPLQVEYRICTNQESCVDPLLAVAARVVHNLLLRQGIRLELFVELDAVAVQHRQIERTKVRVKALVHQFLVHAEDVAERR
uniref:Putative secreted protein n=1 Tax=Ixodes ricinus TaxID=34613 RepID=A0A6B0VAJ6_IXORI